MVTNAGMPLLVGALSEEPIGKIMEPVGMYSVPVCQDLATGEHRVMTHAVVLQGENTLDQHPRVTITEL